MEMDGRRRSGRPNEGGPSGPSQAAAEEPVPAQSHRLALVCLLAAVAQDCQDPPTDRRTSSSDRGRTH
jgi:hypothetical protein